MWAKCYVTIDTQSQNFANFLHFTNFFKNKIFNVGSKFIALAGFNVSGGNALIPVPKLICRKDNLIMRNDDGEYLDFDEMQQIFE